MSTKDIVIIKYLILPLYNIPFVLIQDDFISAYINKDAEMLYLNVENKDVLRSLNNFHGDVFINDIHFQMFKVTKYLKDVKLIIEGKYSKISPEAKQSIIELSGMKYQEYNPLTKKEVTSAPLLAIDKHPVYKEHVERRLGVQLPDSAELFDKVSDSIFIEKFLEY